MRRLAAFEFFKFINIRAIRRPIYKLKLKYFAANTTRDRLFPELRDILDDPDASIEPFKQRLRERFFLSDLNKKEFYISLMSSLAGFDSIMDDADLVHENKLSVHGAEPFSFGEKIDWHLDFKSGKRWPLSFYTKISALNSAEYPYMKVPWELSRFHQAIWLGKAYWISHNEAHAQKFKDLADDWIDSNPVGYGVNWVSPKESAIRAVNLIIGSMYFMGSESIDNRFFMKLLRSLYDHGVYISHNLEKTLRSGSRYIANLVGLLYLGFFFYDAKSGKKWLKFARRELELSILDQVYEDGTVREESTACQCFVAELLTAAYVLLRLNKFEMSENFKNRLEKMFDFIASATMRDRKMPAIGCCDHGRVFKMKVEQDSNDCTDLLAAAAAVFRKEEFKSAAGRYSELALLLLGTQGFEEFSSLREEPEVKSAIFPEGGFAFLKTGKDFCSFVVGDIRRRERERHSHNDALSFTISGKNQFMVDRGACCHTCDTNLRNKLRSTYSHNTAVVDEIEQAKFSGFRPVKRDLNATKLLKWLSTPEQDVVEARYRAHERLAQRVIHKRKITFNKRRRTFLVEDNFLGAGIHQIDLMFHFAPGLTVTDLGQNFLALEGEEFALLKFQHAFTLEDWEHSPGYGILNYAKSARLKLSTEFPAKLETFVFILNNLEDIHYLLNRFQ
ncbi:MAG: heparinase II/III family protein [Candidatus Kryptoniota bacterium]